MSIRDIPHLNFNHLLKELDKQGFIVNKTTKGVRVYSPNGGQNSTILHRSSVDNPSFRSWENITSKLRSMGFVSPEERKRMEKEQKNENADPLGRSWSQDLGREPAPPKIEWVTVKEAAELLEVTPTYMHALIKSRELDVKYDKVGSDGRLFGKRVRAIDVEALIDRPRKPHGEPMPRTRTSTGRKLQERAPRVVVIKPERFEKAIEKMAEAVDLLRQAFITPKEVDDEGTGVHD